MVDIQSVTAEIRRGKKKKERRKKIETTGQMHRVAIKIKKARSNAFT